MSDFVSRPPANTSLCLRDFIEKFPLPQVVKVYEGYYDKHQRSTVSADAVYRLISLESVETVLLEDADGQETRIPIDYSCTVERVAEEKFQQRQLGIAELLQEHNPGVKFVRVIESDPNYESLVKAGDKLKIDQKKRKTGETFLPVKNIYDKGKTLWKLPVSCKVKFLALLDGEGLPLARFVKKNKLPAYVCFTDNSTKESIDEDIPLPTGVVKLKGTLIESFVKATTEDQDVKTELSFPIMLPISVMTVEMDPSIKSPVAKFDSDINEATDEYEDMSGYRAKSDFKSPCLKTSPQRNKEANEKPLAISEFQKSGERVHHGNTYSPPPSMKVARSNYSLLGHGKGRSLIQRTLSNLELRTNTTESDEHVYDDLNFSYLNSEKLKSRSLSSVPRRKSDSSTEQVSKQNLNNLLQVQAQSLQGDDFQGKIETVSLQIRRKSLVYNETSRKMNTFGRKGTTGGETESVRSDVNALDSILEDQSYSSNPSLLSRSETKNSPFYGSEEMDLDKEPKVLPVSVPKRSSADVLPPLPIVQEPCPVPRETKGKFSLTSSKVQVLPVNNKEIKKNLLQPSPRRDKVTNQNRNQKSQSPSSAGIGKDTCVNEGILPICQSQDDIPPPIPSRNKQRDSISSPVSSPTLEVNAPSSRVGQPVSPSREKSRSFRGIEQGNPTMVSSPDGKAPLGSLSPVAKPRSISASFQEKCNEKEASATSSYLGSSTLQGSQTMHVSGENPQTPVSEKAESKFTIPEDLSFLRVTEVLQCLRKLNMNQFEEIFKERQVDGSMLLCLDEEALESFGMDRFYRLKLLRFIAGWRPQL